MKNIFHELKTSYKIKNIKIKNLIWKIFERF